MAIYSGFDNNFTVLREIEKLKKRIEIMQKEIAELEGGGGDGWKDPVSILQEQMAKAEQDIATLQSLTEGLDVSKITADIAAIKLDLDDIDESIEELHNGKQDVLVFDDTPTAGSKNPVTSEGIAAAIASGGGSIVIDQEVTAGSYNAVSSDAVDRFTKESLLPITAKQDLQETEIAALKQATEELESGKQDVLTFDDTPTAGSKNPVTSEGIAAAIASGSGQAQLYVLDDDGTTRHNIADQVDREPLASGLYRLITSAAVKAAVDTLDEAKQAVLKNNHTGEKIIGVTDLFDASTGIVDPTADNLVNADVAQQMYLAFRSLYNNLNVNIGNLTQEVAGKQNLLTFDTTPTVGSDNPVTSDGIAGAIASAGGGDQSWEIVKDFYYPLTSISAGGSINCSLGYVVGYLEMIRLTCNFVMWRSDYSSDPYVTWTEQIILTRTDTPSRSSFLIAPRWYCPTNANLGIVQGAYTSGNYAGITSSNAVLPAINATGGRYMNVQASVQCNTGTVALNIYPRFFTVSGILTLDSPAYEFYGWIRIEKYKG